MTFLQGLMLGLGIVVGLILIYLVVLVFFPILRVVAQPIEKALADTDREAAPDCRQDVRFSVDGTDLHGWLYLPAERQGPLPAIIMSTGFGGTKDAILEQYAIPFVEAGYVVLTYDYRSFGLSGGEPRQVYDVSYQLDDFRAAIAYARQRDEIDPEKIVLWSTSAAGGYGLALAAEDKRIAAIISQCGAIDHKADNRLFMERDGMGFFLRLLMHAQRDKGRSRFGLSPHTFPIVGKPGTTAMFVATGAFAGYSELFRNSKTFRNEVCARLFFMKHGKDPLEASRSVQCPVLFLACEKDNLAAPDSYKRAAEHLGDLAEVKSYPIGHFEIYGGEYFENALGEMIRFLGRHVGSPL